MAQLVRVGPPLFVAPGCPRAGLLVRGNLDINDRPRVKFQGGIATVYDSSFGTTMKIGGKMRKVEVLLPGVWGNAVHTDDRTVWNHYQSTGQHLGIFDNAHHANAYANCLHRYQARVFGAGR